ncbi:3573_t:CDS:1, partial [Funneliformis geosporum]
EYSSFKVILNWFRRVHIASEDIKDSTIQKGELVLIKRLLGIM